MTNAYLNSLWLVNRLGVLLGNKACDQTKTLTHVLWSLLNSIPANSVQRPHRHNSVALDLAVAAKPGVYTLMGKEIDTNGDNLVDEDEFMAWATKVRALPLCRVCKWSAVADCCGCGVSRSK